MAVTFYALSHEDIPGFRPLNTVEGQAWLDAFIDKLGGVDAVCVPNSAKWYAHDGAGANGAVSIAE